MLFHIFFLGGGPAPETDSKFELVLDAMAREQRDGILPMESETETTVGSFIFNSFCYNVFWAIP